MGGSVEGGRKTAAKNKANDHDFYKKIGAKGGRAKVRKGFAVMDKERVRAAGLKGGRVKKSEYYKSSS